MSTTVQPNVLVIQADQLAASALGAYGNPVVRAPNLDALAGQGVVFDRAYCNSPLCVPSRASMLTGELPSTIEAYDNASPFASTIPTFAHELRACGYRTTLAGRMHFIGPDQLHGFEERLTTDVYPADLDMVPDWELADDERLPWYHDAGSVHQAGVAAATLQRDYDEEVAHTTLRHLRDLARSRDGRPWLLVSSFIHPHDPYQVPREHWDRYEGVAVDLPAVPAPAPGEDDPHSRRLRTMCEVQDIPEATVRRARRAYYAAVSYLDDHVGRLLAALEELGLRDDTVVVFTSDHGDMRGERGLWYKMSPLEDSARVPLIVAAPGVSPGRVDRTVSLVDLLPTLVELAGGTPPRRAGTSFVGLLRGEQHGWPDRAVIEYLAEGVRAPQLTLVSERLKLVVCPGDPDQLYDLAADPRELHDLAGDPAWAATLEALRAELLNGRDLDALAARVRESQHRRRLVAAALATGRRTVWDHEPPGQAADYVRGDFWRAIQAGHLSEETGRSLERGESGPGAASTGSECWSRT